MGKWTYRIAILIMIAAIVGGAIYWIWFRTNPETSTGPWGGEDTWLLYPNGGESVSGVINITWNPEKTPKLGPDDKIIIRWTHEVRGAAGKKWDWPYPPEAFQHEDDVYWEGCYCSVYYCVVCGKRLCREHGVPNTGSYQWNATQALEEYNGETYPYYIRLDADVYMDASNRFFNITG